MTFSFDRDGITYLVRTEVGDGLAQVIVEEEAPQESPMETSE